MDNSSNFVSFNKIHRFSRPIIITEKIDGSNAQVFIDEEGNIKAGSRRQYCDLKNDNYGFGRWVNDHKDELIKLGPGRHYGEWWGSKINRNYNLEERRFSLFDVEKWTDDTVRPSCCSVVPILATGIFGELNINYVIDKLKINGSTAAPGYMKPEGIIIFHKWATIYFKKTIEKDEEVTWNKKGDLNGN